TRVVSDWSSDVCSSDLDEAHPFGSSREIDLGYATVRATRITYVGELGWELYVPAEFAAGVYEDLTAAGAEFGLANAGYYAIESQIGRASCREREERSGA